MKVFICQDMKGLSIDRILEIRSKARKYINDNFVIKNEEIVEIIDSMWLKDYLDWCLIEDELKPLWYLGKSLELLAISDVCMFTNDNITGAFYNTIQGSCVDYNIKAIYL